MASAPGARAQPAADPRGEYVPLQTREGGNSRLRVGVEVAAPDASPYLPDLETVGGLESLGLTGIARYDLARPGSRLLPYVGAGVGVKAPLNDPDVLGADRTFLRRLEKTDVGSLGLLGVEAPLTRRLTLYGETRWRHDVALESLARPEARDDVGLFGGFELKFGGDRKP